MSDESLRDALASADAVIARVRASIIGRTGVDPKTQPIPEAALPEAYERERDRFDLDDYLRELRVDAMRLDAARRFWSTYPALFRWRERVFAAPTRVKRSELAAAFEALAIEAVFAGLPDVAVAATAKAYRAVGATPRAIRPKDDLGDAAEGAA